MTKKNFSQLSDQSDDKYYEGLNEGQRKALKIMISGQSTALLGVGGTGKTFVINRYISYAKAHDVNLVVTAPTGIAATNCNGTTIHSQFSLGGVINPTKWNYNYYLRKLPQHKREVIQHVDVLIIDEISMTRYDYFRRIMQIVEAEMLNNHHRIQVIVSGDFGQLPPILTDSKSSQSGKYLTELQVFTQYYPFVHKEAWSFLDTEHWRLLKVVELTEVVRQSDLQFIEALNKIRLGDVSGLDYINEHSAKKPPNESVIICSTNKEVDAINKVVLDQLEGSVKSFKLIYSGDTEGVKLPQDDILQLKRGSEVMATVNAPAEVEYNAKGEVIGTLPRDYINGSFGTVKEIYTKPEKPDEISSVVVEFDNGNTCLIEPYEWDIKSYVYDKKNGSFEEKTVGTIVGIPLRLRAAITVHKSQGMTFNNVIINRPYFWSSGQLYTALSRVTSVEGLYLVEKLKPHHVICSQLVKNFYRDLDKNPFELTKNCFADVSKSSSININQ